MVRGRLLIRTSQSVGAWVLPLPAVVVILMIGVQQLWLLHFEALWSRALSELPLYSGFVQYWTARIRAVQDGRPAAPLRPPARALTRFRTAANRAVALGRVDLHRLPAAGEGGAAG